MIIIIGCDRLLHRRVFYRCMTHAGWLLTAWEKNELLCGECMKANRMIRQRILPLRADHLLMGML
jgi:hypothetical protein